MTTTTEAINAAVARATELGLVTTTALEDTTALGPTIHAGNLSLGFLYVGPEVDIVILNTHSGDRSVRHCGTDPAAIADAAAMFISSVTP